MRLAAIQEVFHSNELFNCIMTGYGLNGRGFGVRIPVGQDLYPCQAVYTGSGTQSASYPMGNGESFPGE